MTGAAGEGFTRRRAAGLALRAGAAAMPAAAALRAGRALASSRDLTIAGSLLRLEGAVAVACRAAVRTGALDRRAAGVVALIASQQEEHLARLGREVRMLAANPPAPPRSLHEAEALLGHSAPRRGSERTLAWLAEAESTLLRAYSDALVDLEDGRLLQVAGQAMASAAQHLVLLRQALGRDPLPTAYERGRPSAGVK